MKNNALENFITSIKGSWTGLNSETVIKGRKLLEQLAKTPISESWLADLHHKKQESVELYRDQNQGFILLAHVERQGNYRVPHNHGAGWVFYAVQHGTMEMSTYSQVTDKTGKSFLVSRGANDLNTGECNVYLPDDIHDTKCLSDYVLMFRLTSCDFKSEKREGRLVQYTN
jgi:hypothetical protein